ncbi:MAG: hypothetical protein JJ974_03595 [Phycisphaerales bacterium]|nr:hypothetical protein [Phycisphaerales bacterium]
MDQPPRNPKHIRFCVNNPRTLQERQHLLAEGFTCRDCLSNCTQCFETRFLEIDDTFIEGDSYQSICQSANPPHTLPPTPEHDSDSSG